MRIQNLINRPNAPQVQPVREILGMVTPTEATVYVYGEISDDSDDPKKINSLDFVKIINSLDVPLIHCRLNTPGGDIFAALAMQTALSQHKAKVIAHIDGVAASSGTRVMLGADEIEISDGGFVMIHRVMAPVEVVGYFTSEELLELMVSVEQEIGKINSANDTVMAEYVQKTKQPPEKIKEWMDKTTFFTAQEALSAGFVDRIYSNGKQMRNCWDFSAYKNAPEALKKISFIETENKSGIPAVDTSALLRRVQLEEQF